MGKEVHSVSVIFHNATASCPNLRKRDSKVRLALEGVEKNSVGSEKRVDHKHTKRIHANVKRCKHRRGWVGKNMGGHFRGCKL